MRLPLLPIAATFALLTPLGVLAQDDSSNAIRATTVLHEDGSKTVTITDPDKHTSESTTYDGRDRILQRVVYTLDDNNQAASGIAYTADNRPVYKSVYKRDDMNRVKEEDDLTMDDQLIRRYVYDFGPDGKVIKVHAFDPQGNELQPASGTRRDPRQSLPRTH
jgi:hypothetical protein